MHSNRGRGGLDFLVIGAHKSGTTTLWHQLRGHPELALPAAKEAPYFSDDRLYVLGMKRYLRVFFGEPEHGSLLGTVTPQYMSGGRSIDVPGVASRIGRELPNVKLIALLRDPVERAVSHYRMSVRRGDEHRGLEPALHQQLAAGALAAARLAPRDVAPPDVRGHVFATSRYVVNGEYGRILAAYRRHFPASQMLVLLTAELDRDPDGLLGRVLAFLEVDDAWRPEDIHARHLVGGDRVRLGPEDMRSLRKALLSALPDTPGSAFDHTLNEWNTLPDPAPAIEPADDLRARLRRHFAADAAKLEELFGLRVPWGGIDVAAESPAAAEASVARSSPDRAATPETVAAEVDAALTSEAGYALIRIGPLELALLHGGQWTAHGAALARVGVWDLPVAAAKLRQAIALADRTTDEFIALDRERLFHGRRIAFVCPPALLGDPPRAARGGGRRRGKRLDIALTIALGHMRELDRTFVSLAAQREAYDVVLVAGEVTAQILCSRLARELGVVALDATALATTTSRRTYPAETRAHGARG